MGGEVGALLAVLADRHPGQVGGGPDLPMRVRLRAAHHLALVLEHLHPGVRLSQRLGLGAPGVDEGQDLGGLQLGQPRAWSGEKQITRLRPRVASACSSGSCWAGRRRSGSRAGWSLSNTQGPQ
jgi:hypothetical protein